MNTVHITWWRPTAARARWLRARTWRGRPTAARARWLRARTWREGGQLKQGDGGGGQLQQGQGG